MRRSESGSARRKSSGNGQARDSPDRHVMIAAVTKSAPLSARCNSCSRSCRRRSASPAVATPAGALRCADCHRLMRPYPPAEDLWAAYPYDGPAGALVRALKFDGRVAIADAMAAQLVANAPAELLAGTVVPVPVHPDHRRRRGIDHAAVLARALAARAGLDCVECLQRVGDPRPQVGRGRRERMHGPLGAIRLRPGAAAPPEVLLVDDVLTTGATLSASIRAVSVDGCARVRAIAYARTTAR